jgi:hypothetical protein
MHAWFLLQSLRSSNIGLTQKLFRKLNIILIFKAYVGARLPDDKAPFVPLLLIALKSKNK